MHGEMPGARQQVLHLVVRQKALIPRPQPASRSLAMTRLEEGRVICLIRPLLPRIVRAGRCRATHPQILAELLGAASGRLGSVWIYRYLDN